MIEVVGTIIFLFTRKKGGGKKGVAVEKTVESENIYDKIEKVDLTFLIQKVIMTYLEARKHSPGYSDVWGRSFYLCGGNGGIIMSSRQYTTKRAMNRKMKELLKNY